MRKATSNSSFFLISVTIGVEHGTKYTFCSLFQSELSFDWMIDEMYHNILSVYQILDHLTLNDLVATENNWPRTKPTNFETVPSILRIEKVIWKTAR